MAVLQMQRFSICAMKKDRKAILEELQRLGVTEIDTSAVEDDYLKKQDTVEFRQTFEKNALLAEHALDVLDQYVPEKKSMFDSLAGKKLVEKQSYLTVSAQTGNIMQTADQLVNLNKEFGENKANILKLENQIESLSPWMPLGVPMNAGGTQSAGLLIGSIPQELSEADIRTKLSETAPELEAYDVNVLSSDKDATYLTVVCLRKELQKMEEALRANGFAKPSQMSSKTPAQQKAEMEQEIGKLNKRNEQIEANIKDYSGSRQDLEIVSDYFRVRSEKYQVLGQLPQSVNTFLISGYVPKSAAPLLEKEIANKYVCTLDVEEIKEDEEAPVLLKNNAFSESVEGVLESYGLPNKGEIDPTTIMSFFYVFFFGMMLSDAAYGFIIFLACFIVLKKFPRMEQGMHKMLKMFMFCGVSTMVWGILFGGYFGDVITVVAKTFFDKDITVPALWFVPLNDPMRLLLYSLAFGVVHLFAGLAIKGYTLLKNGQTMDFICDVVIWYVFLIGLLLLLIPSSLFASIAQINIVFPPFLSMLAKVMSIGGAIGLLLMSGRSSKNWGLRIALGAYDIYGITGWLSDVLSYSRLLALGLATGVIASVVNQMGSMFGKGVVGAIGFIVVFCVGHVLNMAINILGAYVHTNRLQFVEFFGKFYEGGGRPFAPFKQNTKYVDIKEETNQ